MSTSIFFSASVAFKNQVRKRQNINSKNQFREIEIFENQLQIDTLMQKLRCHNFTTVFMLIDTNPIGKFILETFQGIKTWHTIYHLKVSSKNLQLVDQSESWILKLILWLVDQPQICGGNFRLIDHGTSLILCKDSNIDNYEPISQ